MIMHQSPFIHVVHISHLFLHLGCWWRLWSFINCSKGEISLWPIPKFEVHILYKSKYKMAIRYKK